MAVMVCRNEFCGVKTFDSYLGQNRGGTSTCPGCTTTNTSLINKSDCEGEEESRKGQSTDVAPVGHLHLELKIGELGTLRLDLPASPG